jgi:hypothetical protein
VWPKDDFSVKLRARNLLIVVRHIMGRIFFADFNNSTVFNRTRLELLVVL